MNNFDLKKYLAEGKLHENVEQGYTLYTTNVEYDSGKTGYMYQLVNSEDREENEIGFDQLYFDDEDNRLEMGVDFKDFDQGSYQEGEYTADEAMKLYNDLAEGKLLKEDEGQFAAEEKALGTLFHPNPDQEDAEYSPYVYDEEAFINLIKDMGYSDYKEVASEFLHYFSPADEDELRILRHNERNPELQPTDLTVGMYTRNIQKEFPIAKI